MKILYKTYFLLAIIIGAALINLGLLYSLEQERLIESNTIIRANDLKVKVETVATFASSIASGNEEDRYRLQQESDEIDTIFDVLESGGLIRDQQILPVPTELKTHFDDAYTTWLNYKKTAQTIQKETVFDPQVRASLAYVLEKDGDLLLLTDGLVKELESLGRDYRRHVEIATELRELAKAIGSDALLISIGEEDARDSIHENRLRFDVGLRKLLQIPLDDLDVSGLGIEYENIAPIPRENSETLRQIDPLWEAIGLRLLMIESKPLISSKFGDAMKNLTEERLTLFSSLDKLLDSWNTHIQEKRSEKRQIVLYLTILDLFVFIFVIYTIRRSLNPLGVISKALSKVKEGVYGEKITYKSSDEIGDLVDKFNIMSVTIREKEEEARKIDQSKDEFLAMITHELKTPLVPIQGYSDILLSGHLGKLTKEQRERLEVIKSSSKSLLQLITDLLDVQKLNLGQMRMKKENTSIGSTIEKAIEVMMPEANANHIEITHNAKDVYVSHDQERIVQVLANLIKNSLKAVSPNTGKIQVLLHDSPQEVRISVIDNGIGIPEEYMKKMFTKFYQVDSSLTREKGGSGLGLAICKGIIEAHGGKISVENNSGGGATFSFVLTKT
jgi:signal transduction histidine kinase